MANLRNVLDQLNDPSLRAVIQEEAYREIRKSLEETKAYNPYAQALPAADSLEKMGILTNPLAVRAHTHAAAKSIELNMYSIVATYLPKENPVTFMFMKRAKLQYFRRGPQHNDIFLNAHIEPKDVARYPLGELFDPHRTPKIQTSTAFMGDALHYMEPEVIPKLFTTSDTLQSLYATLVLPPEAMHRMHSLHPSIYELEFHKEHFLYKPGGSSGAAYVHTYNQLVWLKIGRFKWKDDQGRSWVVTAQVLETKGANHLMLFQRGNLLTPELRSFGVETKFITIPPIFLPEKYNARLPIKKNCAQQLFLYVKSVKGVTERDIWAKIRQLIKTSELQDYSAKELTLLVNYFYLISRLKSENCFQDVLSGGIINRLCKPLIAWYQELKMKMLGKEEFVQLMEALEWVDVNLTYEVFDFEFGSTYKDLSNGRNWLHGEDLPEKAEEPEDQEPSDPDWYQKYIQLLENTNSRVGGQEQGSQSSQSGVTEDEEAKPGNETPGETGTDSLGAPENSESSGKKNTTLQCPCGLELPIAEANFPEIPVLEHPDRLKGRLAYFFSKDNKPYSYTGGSHASRGWPNWLDSILATVGKSMMLPEFNQCLVQKYERGASIPFHRDNEPCYPKGHQVLTINLEGQAEFSVSCKSGNATTRMEKGTYFLSPPGFQESHQHAVKSLSASRISLTFRCTQIQNVFGEGLSSEVIDQLPWKAWLEKIRHLGFQGTSLQYDYNGALISPIERVQSLPKVFPKGAPGDLLSTLDKWSRAPTPYCPSKLRAKAYSSDVKNLRVGALLRQQGKEWAMRFDSLVESGERELAISVIHGAGGSGKSKLLQCYIQDNPETNITIVLPTNELRIDWLKKLKEVRESKFKTFEKALLSPPTPVVIFDDYGKLPAGYIEAFCLYFSTVELIILTGDSKQSVHHEPNENAMTSQLEPFVWEAEKFCRYYINATHRNKRDLANRFGVYSEVTGVTEITHGSTPIPGRHMLVPSIYKKLAFTEMGHKVSTYAGCQGITAPSVQILLTEETALCSKEVMYTALSRAVHSIHFINTSPNNKAFWSKLECTPYLKAFLSTLREETAVEDKPKGAEPTPVEPPKTHIAKDSAMPIYENIIEEMPEKHEREIFSNSHGHSNCVQTEDPFIQMFSHQQAKDETLLWATIEARLKISNPKANWQEYLEKKPVGDVLFESYRQAMKLPDQPIPFSEELWESCMHEVQATYLKKPEVMIKNGMGRQSPDYDPHVISLFLKSQWVKKMEKLGAVKIKPGQTIASFHQATVMLFGTMARYMRRMREVFQPRNIKINCETTPEELTEWLAPDRGGWTFKGPSLANDYTAFDQSQDGAMLQFEILKAKHHSIPEDVLNAYLDIKLNSKIFLGVLSIMRLTGEGPTFDANTECNIAFTHTKFQIPEGTAQIYAGDDSAIDAVPPIRPSFKLVEQKLTLRSKPVVAMQERGDWAEFCGYRITKFGFIKDPKKLHASLMLEIKRGNLKNVKDSYEIDLGLAYYHKDRLHEIMSEEELRCHYETVRTLVRSGGGKWLKTFISKDESLY
ncbi:RdRp [Senna mosaic virus]|uniref:RNA replication protein n=1 Tax=Senna mosaic virus TaxID=1881013 RepID=A0A1B1V3I5_9VIRU|nr:RdRp [Senna mosaic virus]ANW11492.1 RdRp [Senna mosaic virus]